MERCGANVWQMTCPPSNRTYPWFFLRQKNHQYRRGTVAELGKGTKGFLTGVAAADGRCSGAPFY